MLLRFVRKVPVTRLLLPFLAGALLLSSADRFVVSLLLAGFWGLLLYRFLEHRLPSAWSVRWIPGLCLFCLWMGLGGSSMGRVNKRSSFPQAMAGTSAATSKESVFFARICVVSLPSDKPKSRQCEVEVELPEEPFSFWKGKHLQVYLPKNERTASIGIGDRLFVRLKPQRPKPPVEPGGFDYGAWLRHKGIAGTSWVSDQHWEIVSKASPFHLKALAERIRQHLLLLFASADIEGEPFALVSALVLGSTDRLTPETKNQFSVSGISHILSVSGLHVAVVYAVLAFLLSFLDRFERFRVPKQLLLIVLLFTYAFVTGLSPSVLRSAFMFSLLAFGKCLHRKSQTINTVLFSAFVLLLWNPGFLFDLGFQLSYLAVLSIVVVHPRLTAMWTPAFRPIRYVWEMLCLSLVAQLGTAPLTVHAFHTFPNYFLVNNLLAVPFSSLLIYLAVSFLMLGNIPYIGDFMGKLLDTALHTFLTMVETMGNLPYALTENLYPGVPEIVVIYLIMGTFFFWIVLKKRVWVFPFLLSVLTEQILYAGRCFW
jgi:competence protein ComEC